MPSCTGPLPWMALTLALSGCGGNVVVDGSATAGAATQSSNALVVNVPDPGGICTLETASDPPGAVFLIVASQPLTCAHHELLLPDLECPAGTAAPSTLWEICIPLQAELAPATIHFDAYSPEVELVSAAAGCVYSEEGILQQGTLAITTVDPSSMTLTLSGTGTALVEGSVSSPAYEVDADGTYEALRCP